MHKSNTLLQFHKYIYQFILISSFTKFHKENNIERFNIIILHYNIILKSQYIPRKYHLQRYNFCSPDNLDRSIVMMATRCLLTYVQVAFFDGLVALLSSSFLQ